MKDTTNAKNILERLKTGSGARSDTDLGRMLGVSQQAIYNARTAEKIPDAWVRKATENSNISADWVLFGVGNILRSKEKWIEGQQSVASKPVTTPGQSDVDGYTAELERRVAELKTQNVMLMKDAAAYRDEALQAKDEALQAKDETLRAKDETLASHRLMLHQAQATLTAIEKGAVTTTGAPASVSSVPSTSHTND